uniref:Uncharacterized protein n=1 Tax=Nelumbo nucifera TaxID=4432 RepID=A0A822Y405_NELNU|nr:TPA_asm: hypothetical protein HUJ06_027507 [Nelumbo nucifera]
MATTTAMPLKKENVNLPPKRGQIKARIFSNLFKTVTKVAKEEGGRLNRKRQKGDGGSSNSVSATPTSSAYASESEFCSK